MDETWQRPQSDRRVCSQPPAPQRSAGRWSCAAVGVIKSGKTLISSAPSLLFFHILSSPAPAPPPCLYLSGGTSSPPAPPPSRAADATRRSFHKRTSIAGPVCSGPAAAAALQRDLDCVSAGFSSATGINSHQFQFQIRTFRKRGASAKKFLSCRPPTNPLQ